MSYKGRYKPRNPLKYQGDPTNIIYRSSWEAKLMKYLDDHPDVLSWASEEIAIPYRSPIDNKIHRYFPDFKIKKRNSKGIVETIIIEVKPKSQTTPPKIINKVSKKYVSEVYTWGINSAKWEAAKNYCGERKWKFLIMTEEHLGIKNV